MAELDLEATTASTPVPRAAKGPAWWAVGCGVLGLVLNLLPIPIPGGMASFRLGGAPVYLSASLHGWRWGALTGAIAAVALWRQPSLAAGVIVAAALAGEAVRRGFFVTPVVALFWSTIGVVLAVLQHPGEWSSHAFGTLVSGLVAGVAADAASVIPGVGSRGSQWVKGRGFASHFGPAFAVAGLSPILAVAAMAGPSTYSVAIGVAAIVAIGAVVGAEVIGRRTVAILDHAMRSAGQKADDNVFLDVSDAKALTTWIERERASMRDSTEILARRLAEREAAYAELLRLSERLEESVQLRGVEIEQRAYLLELSQKHYREVVEHASDIIYELDLAGRFTTVNAAGERFFGRDIDLLVGRPWHQTLAPGYDRVLGGVEGMQALLEPLNETRRFDAVTVHRAANDEIRLLETRLELVCDEDGLPVSISGVSRDVTEIAGFQTQVQKLGEELDSMRLRWNRLERELNALLSVARVNNSEFDIDPLLQHVIESAAANIGAESGFVGLLDEGALTLRWYWRSSGASWVDLDSPRVERGITQIVMETRQPYLCADAEADPNTDKEFTKRFAVKSMLVLPIFSQTTELLGAMALHNFPLEADPDGEPAVNDTDLRFLEGLADLASAAIQQAGLLERIRQQAETDPLTGLFNRRAFNTRFDEEIERAKRFERPFALVLIDIDFLKKINDTFGHPIGDAAICTVADVLTSRMRRHDFAARIGGEEFAVLVVEGRADTAGAVARSLLESLRRRDVPRVGHITASLGVALFPEDADSRDELFRMADEALYRAKNSGRNRVVQVREMQALDSADSD